MRPRRLIAAHLPGYHLSGEVEADESYFGGIRKGKRGSGSAGKTAGSGLLKRNGKVRTAINPNTCAATLTPIIEGRVDPDSIAHTDTFKVYNALGVNGFHHHRPNHSRLSAEQADHINGTGNFWNQAKRHLRRFSGIRPEHFYWFLKKREWRFNAGNHREPLSSLIYWDNAAKH